MKRHFHNRINQYLNELNAEERDMKLHNNDDNDDYNDWDEDDTEWDDDDLDEESRDRRLRKAHKDIQQDITSELSELDKELREAYQDGLKDGHAEAVRMVHVTQIYTIPLYVTLGTLFGLLLRTIIVTVR